MSGVTVGPGQAAWLKSVELWGPGHAATWDDLSDDERKGWHQIANAGIGGSEYVRGLEATATEQPAPDLGTAWRLLGEARALLDHETRLTWQSGLPGERARVAVVRESAGLEAL